jgi:hypothetical protein
MPREIVARAAQSYINANFSVIFAHRQRARGARWATKLIAKKHPPTVGVWP